MPSLASTSLSSDGRALLERFASVLRTRLGVALHAIWRFGSRARGEPPTHEDSDIDLLVLVDDASRTASGACTKRSVRRPRARPRGDLPMGS
jgi:predicted nucleotidyltransferase